MGIETLRRLLWVDYFQYELDTTYTCFQVSILAGTNESE